MILFYSIKWRNFLSTGNYWTNIDFTKHATTLIVGRNGEGKSTLIDALTFALYGKAYRKINKPQLVNSINGKECVVELEFDVGKKKYKIVRGIKPNIFEIYQNGVLLNQESKTVDYQEYLEKIILKMGFKAYTQIVVLGAATFVPFMQLDPKDRAVIEDILDIQIFTTMSKVLKIEIDTIKNQITTNQRDIDVTQGKIDVYRKTLLQQSEDVGVVIQTKQTEIGELLQKIHELEVRILDLTTHITFCEDILKDEEKIKEQKEELRKLDNTIGNRLGDVKKEISFFEEHDNCPTCQQSIDMTFKINHVDNLDKKKQEYLDGLDKLSKKMEKIDEKLKKFEPIHNDRFEFIQKRAELNTEKYGYSNFMDRLLKEVVELNKKKEVMATGQDDVEFNYLLNNIDNLKVFKDDLSETMKYCMIEDSLLKNIKPKIVKQYVPIINKSINNYLSAMNFFAQFEIDENFNEKIKSRFRDEFTYESFSEGEKVRIDLSILFTWRFVAKQRNSVSSNLLILDEIFESALDSSGSDDILKLLQILSKDANIFILSPKGDILYEKFDNVLRFEKKKGFSRLLEG